MEVLIRELFSELVQKPVKDGDYAVINVKEYFEQTGFLLSTDDKHLSNRKRRPIIIVDTSNDAVKFVATTTYIFIRDSRPKINLSSCKIIKPKEECFGLNLKRKYTWLFAQETSKGWRFFYQIDIYTLKELIKNNKFVICGNCKSLIPEIIQKIEDFGDYV